jgi:fructose-bisphosphate aldolase, class I
LAVNCESFWPEEKYMNGDDLNAIAREMAAPGKGILAADESGPTIEKRFQSIGIISNEENRRAYREMLFSTPGLGEYVSGVILFDETIRQKTSKGKRMVDLLRDNGMMPGIKVDKGAKPLAGFTGDKITEGLDGLRERLGDYHQLGARFAKWRAVFKIGDGTPSRVAMASNAEALARYAALSQEMGLVPIVEPEVLMDGNHGMEVCELVTRLVLHAVFNALFEHRVRLEEMILKPNMVTPGEDASQPAAVQDVARETLRCFHRVVPAAVPGIAFLSGGQHEMVATQHLNALNTLEGRHWELSFSFGRALQAPALQAWGGESHRVEAAQRILLHRARCNSAARSGRYFEEMEREDR